MSSVGKAREHELQKRQREEDKSKASISWKTVSDDEIKERILALLKSQGIPYRDLRQILRLTFVNALRLGDIIADLEKAGKVEVRDHNGEKLVFLKSNTRE